MLAMKQKTSRPHAEHRQKKTNSFTFLFLNRIRTACKQCSSNVCISVFNLRYPVDVLRHCNLIEFSDYTLVACNKRSFRFTETHPSFWIIPRFLVSKYIHYYRTHRIHFLYCKWTETIKNSHVRALSGNLQYTNFLQVFR